MAGGVQEIETANKFKDIISDNTHVMVDFYADWCGPCKRISPQIEDLSMQEKYSKVVFLKVNVDKDDVRDIVDQYKIEAMPTFLFFVNGQRDQSLEVVGASLEKIKQSLDKMAK